jgi:hypothetical protein
MITFNFQFDKEQPLSKLFKNQSESLSILITVAFELVRIT